MNPIRSNIIINSSVNAWIYYASLLAVLLLSFASYFIADVAQGQTTHAISHVGSYVITQYSLMAFFMLIAWYTSPNSSTLKSYKWLLLIAVIARVALIDIAPYSSNDVDRYLFDGRIAYEGYDPYQVSHNNPQLTELRKEWQPPQEHAKYVTLYPPLSLAFFTFSSSFGIENAQKVWQLILLTTGLLTLWITGLVLKKANKLKHLALVALSPLLILETGVGLHLDALSTLAVICAIYLWQHKKMALCGGVIGLGMAIKILPLMLLLPLFFIQRSFKKASALVVNCALTITLVYGTTYALGFYPVGSISVFFEKWRSASPLFSVINEQLSNVQVMVLILSIVGVFVSAIAYFCYKNSFSHHIKNNKVNSIGLSSEDFNNNSEKNKESNNVIYACLQLSVALPLFISPVLFPWYLLPLVPLLALWPNKYLIIWMLIMPLTYEVLGEFMANQNWNPAQWPIVILGIFYLFTLFNACTYIVKHFKTLNNDTNTRINHKKIIHVSSNKL